MNREDILMILFIQSIIIVINFLIYFVSEDEKQNYCWYNFKSKYDLMIRLIKALLGGVYTMYCFIKWICKSSVKLVQYYNKLEDTHI